MGWVRRHNRLGGFFALAALALQIVLSFGHVHLDGVRSPVAQHAVGHGVTLAKASPQLPAHNPGTDDDYCAICASIYLASTSLVAQAPPVPVPVHFVHIITHVFTTERGLSEPRRVAFRSRAPPAALT